jgi:hypothetical protein
MQTRNITQFLFWGYGSMGLDEEAATESVNSTATPPGEEGAWLLEVRVSVPGPDSKRGDSGVDGDRDADHPRRPLCERRSPVGEILPV